MMLYLRNVTLYTPTEKLHQGVLICDGEKITGIGYAHDLPCPEGAQVIDLGGLNLVPGFVDLQTNGAFGMDFTSNPETIWQVGERLVRYGVTSFLPTIISSPDETIHHAQAVLQKGPPQGYQGAQVIGLHLEGPYLNPEKSGAHDPSYLRLPEPKVYEKWNPDTHIRLVTLAPELDGAIQSIQALVHKGVVVSVGHSQANYTQIQEGIEAGIRYGTHLFNAMPPMDHRQPGIVEALLGDSRIITGMIVDGIHVHQAMVNLAWKILGSNRTSLITDAMAALGMPPGLYRLGGRTIHADGTSAQLDDGRLAGSVLSLDQALRNLMAFTGCSLEEALPTITQVPAQLLGLVPAIGRLMAGAKADFVLLSPDNQISGVWIKGREAVSARV